MREEYPRKREELFPLCLCIWRNICARHKTNHLRRPEHDRFVVKGNDEQQNDELVRRTMTMAHKTIRM